MIETIHDFSKVQCYRCSLYRYLITRMLLLVGAASTQFDFHTMSLLHSFHGNVYYLGYPSLFASSLS